MDKFYWTATFLFVKIIRCFTLFFFISPIFLNFFANTFNNLRNRNLELFIFITNASSLLEKQKVCFDMQHLRKNSIECIIIEKLQKFINVNKTTEYTGKCSTESLDCKKITGCNVTSDLIGHFIWCALERGVYVKIGHSRLSCAPSWFIVYIVYHPIFNFYKYPSTDREVKQMNGYVYGNLCCYKHTYTHYWFMLYLVKQVARVRVRVLSNCYIFILLTNMSSPIIWPLWYLRHCFRYTWKRDMICWYGEIKHIWYSIKSIYFQV